MAAAYDVEIRGDNETILLAAQELERYLRKALGGARIRLSGKGRQDEPGFIVADARDVPEAVAPAQIRDGGDLDQIFILSHGRRVVLAGNNPRSVLFAVYDFLERLGFRWLHPGLDGEVVPQLKTAPLSNWRVMETASFRYRGVCVEGAYTSKHAKAFVDWMAKKKMNHFYMQLENGTFWYRRMVPGLKISEGIKWDREIMAEVRRRGLMLEWYGHGWNHNALGKHVICLSKAYKVPDPLQPFLAQVNGRRAWHNNYPHETQLCLTHPGVRKKILACVERVIRRNPRVDILGLWLADGYNNRCECPRCRKFRMSEMYADYVNEIAELAHRLRPGLKIEILAYMSTLEYPRRASIRNPHRNLILMLAPLCRCYRHRLYDPGCKFPGQIPKFPVLNKQPGFSLRNADFAGYFAGWRKRYSGDTYLFDYHLWFLDHDFLSGNIPEMLSRDIRDLAKNGFDGYVGCQVLRCFWPSGLAMKVMAETLWNVRKSYETIRREHLTEWFGDSASSAGRALDRMYRATSVVSLAHDQWPTLEQLLEAKKALGQVSAKIGREAHQASEPLVRRRLRFLADHAKYLADKLCYLKSSQAGDRSFSKTEQEAVCGRLTKFFTQRAQDAELLIDAQYHGRAFLPRMAKRKRHQL